MNPTRVHFICDRPGIRNLTWGMAGEEASEMKYQLGEGCGIDAVVAQWHADLCSLGEIFDPGKTRSTLRAIHRHNFQATARSMANPWRVFRLNDEAGTTMAAWPAGKRQPSIPLPYAQESMTGFEYAFAAHLVQNGLVEEGLECVAAVRHRYDGRKRNPWNEMECGSNYARAMASYSLLNAFSGFEYDLVRGRMGFHPRGNVDSFRCFWALDGAWGEVESDRYAVTLRVLQGRLRLSEYCAHRAVFHVEKNKTPVPSGTSDRCVVLEPLDLTAGDAVAFYFVPA